MDQEAASSRIAQKQTFIAMLLLILSLYLTALFYSITLIFTYAEYYLAGSIFEIIELVVALVILLEFIILLALVLKLCPKNIGYNAIAYLPIPCAICIVITLLLRLPWALVTWHVKIRSEPDRAVYINDVFRDIARLDDSVTLALIIFFFSFYILINTQLYIRKVLRIHYRKQI